MTIDQAVTYLSNPKVAGSHLPPLLRKAILPPPLEPSEWQCLSDRVRVAQQVLSL
jgi:hypothetical protein